MSSKLEIWVGYMTNIGVIIGLVLVAYQVSQTNDALERNPEGRAQVSQEFARQILDRIYGKPGHEAQFKRWSELPGSIGALNFVEVVVDVRTSEYESKASQQ